MDTKKKYTKIGIVLFAFYIGACGEQPDIVAADTRKVNVSLVAAQGENGMTCDEIKRQFADVKAIYAENVGINLNLKWFRCMNYDGPVQTLDMTNRIQVLQFWQKFFNQKSRFKGTKVLHMAVMNPIKAEGRYWIAGIASRTCAYGRARPVALSNAEMKNQDGAPRYRHSVIGFAHESGHLLGASHDTTLPATIMNPAPAQYVDNYPYAYMPFSARSVEEIKRCLIIK